MKNLNLGCGMLYESSTKDTTWVNTDISKEIKADLYFDVSKDPFPLEDEDFNEIYCSGVLEQIQENTGLVHALNECNRVLKKNGLLHIVVPNGKYAISYRDPMDCRRFMEETWEYLDRDSRYYRDYGIIYGFKPWKIIKNKTNDRGIMEITIKKCE